MLKKRIKSCMALSDKRACSSLVYLLWNFIVQRLRRTRWLKLPRFQLKRDHFRFFPCGAMQDAAHNKIAAINKHPNYTFRLEENLPSLFDVIFWVRARDITRIYLREWPNRRARAIQQKMLIGEQRGRRFFGRNFLPGGVPRTCERRCVERIRQA